MINRTLRIPGGDVDLEAALHCPDGVPPFAGVVVCHPHPQYGGDMNNNVVMALCRSLTDRGMAALRFNFRGAGRSSGSYDGGRGEARDVMALAGATDPVRALALISPPLQALDRERLATLGRPLLMIAGDGDHICPEEAFRELATALTGEVEAEVVPGADHFWGGYERDIDSLAGPFFARALLVQEVS
jgi:alpha/beta superfamily hydrolase